MGQQHQEAAEKTLTLFDTYWFHQLILLPPPPPPPPPPQPSPESNSDNSVSHLSRPSSGLRHRRSRSDEATAAAFENLEPLEIQSSGKLGTILSGKEGHVGCDDLRRERRQPEGRRRRPQRRGRSLSELEFEEVKGLRDLGFTFSDAEVDTELVSIVPGLRRRWSEAADAVEDGGGNVPVARPYLSEAWEARDDDEEEMGRMLRNWRIPAAVEGVDLKEHLRLWAHTVASAVR